MLYSVLREFFGLKHKYLTVKQAVFSIIRIIARGIASAIYTTLNMTLNIWLFSNYLFKYLCITNNQ